MDSTIDALTDIIKRQFDKDTQQTMAAVRTALLKLCPGFRHDEIFNNLFPDLCGIIMCEHMIKAPSIVPITKCAPLQKNLPTPTLRRPTTDSKVGGFRGITQTQFNKGSDMTKPLAARFPGVGSIDSPPLVQHPMYATLHKNSPIPTLRRPTTDSKVGGFRGITQTQFNKDPQQLSINLPTSTTKSPMDMVIDGLKDIVQIQFNKDPQQTQADVLRGIGPFVST